MKNFFKLTKGKIILVVGLLALFFSIGIFLSSFYGLPTLLIEKITNEKPEVRIAAYLEAIKKQDKTKALTIWELPDLPNEEISLLEKRREDITKDLIENEVKDFDIFKIEWWGTSCKPCIISNPREAGGARAYVQIVDNSDNRNTYIFDVFHKETSYWGGAAGHPVRHWILRDVYLSDQEPLFWKNFKKKKGSN